MPKVGFGANTGIPIRTYLFTDSHYSICRCFSHVLSLAEMELTFLIAVVWICG